MIATVCEVHYGCKAFLVVIILIHNITQYYPEATWSTQVVIIPLHSTVTSNSTNTILLTMLV